MQGQTASSARSSGLSTFNPHVWGLFLQANPPQGEVGVTYLSIPMSGDSFCKKNKLSTPDSLLLTFQSPCLGTLFASSPAQQAQRFQQHPLSIPMSGDSFCKLVAYGLVCVAVLAAFNPHVWGLFLQVKTAVTKCMTTRPAFNPHVWGLFLQGGNRGEASGRGNCLSIPMSGDSFCKLSRRRSLRVKK